MLQAELSDPECLPVTMLSCCEHLAAWLLNTASNRDVSNVAATIWAVSKRTVNDGVASKLCYGHQR